MLSLLNRTIERGIDYENETNRTNEKTEEHNILDEVSTIKLSSKNDPIESPLHYKRVVTKIFVR